MARKMADTATVEQVDEKEAAKEAKLKPFEDKASGANKERKGIGLRMAAGLTRGKGSLPFNYERFDESIPDSIPKTLADTQKVISEYLTSVNLALDEARTVDFLKRGFNDWSLEQASDPIAEFVDQSWPEDKQTQFRLVVRNTAKMLNMSIEDAAKATLGLMGK